MSIALVVFLFIVALAETRALLLEYQNNAFMQQYVAQNISTIIAEALFFSALGLGSGYVAYRRSKGRLQERVDEPREGTPRLAEPSHGESFASYLRNYQRSFWVYLIIAVSLAETVLAVYGSDSTSLVPLRALLGVLMLGFIPGYSSQRAIFPVGEIKVLERILLSVFLSIIVSISLGTVLGFALAFRPGANAIVLALYTVMATLFAGYRSSRTRSSLSQ